MNYIYEELFTMDGRLGAIKCIDGDAVSSIPIDERNSDYQRYLRWLNGEPESTPVTIGEINE